jgi:hypothetical protein
LTLGQNQFLTDTASSDTSSQSVRTCWLTKDGTITTYDDKDGLEFKVFNTGVQTLHTTILQSPNYRFKLSIPDMSNISLTDELRNSGDNAAILANDLNLRQRAECHSIPVYGSSSFLAGMVLRGIYPYQKATNLYNKWKMMDPQWVPRGLLFKGVLYIERKRNKDKESFWFNYNWI